MSVFATYARFYDALYRDKDYSQEAEWLAHRLRIGPGAGVLDLGCGSGIHAAELARRGAKVVGVDRSLEMLARAQERRDKLPEPAASRLRFVQGDLRDLRLQERFDAVVALFHVLSYQTSDSDLRAMFATAAAHLKVGGVCLFDFWYGPAVSAQRPEVRVKRAEDGPLSFTRIAEPCLRQGEPVIDVHYEVFVENRDDNSVEHVKEVHSMRYLFQPELEGFAAASGLRAESFCGWLEEGPPSERTWSACGLFQMERRQLTR